MPDINKAIVLSDGTVTNLIDPITKQSVNYKPTLVWYDNTAMSNAKCDGNLYRRKGSLFYKKVIDKDGELFLEKDTMDQMRSLSSYEILLLKAGVYKGVRLGGYYTKDDTPGAINYLLTNTLLDDDGGSIIQVGLLKFKHNFNKKVDISYFGAVENEESVSKIQKAIDYLEAAEGGDVIIAKKYRISDVILTKENVNLIFINGAKLILIADKNGIDLNKSVILDSPYLVLEEGLQYTKSLLYCSGDKRIKTRLQRTVVRNVILYGNDVNPMGNGLHFYSGLINNEAVSFVQVDGLHAHGFDKAIFLEQDTNPDAWVTGNIFNNVLLSANRNHFYNEGSDGNVVTNIEFQPFGNSTQRQIYCSGDFNSFNSVVFWDITNPIVIEFTEDSRFNQVNITGGSSGRGLIDNGDSNRVLFNGSQYSLMNRMFFGSKVYNSVINNFLGYAEERNTITSTPSPITSINNAFRPTGAVRWESVDGLEIIIEIEFPSIIQEVTYLEASFNPLYTPKNVKIELYNNNTSSWVTWLDKNGNNSEIVSTNRFQGLSTAANNIKKMRVTFSERNNSSINRLELTYISLISNVSQGFSYIKKEDVATQSAFGLVKQSVPVSSSTASAPLNTTPFTGTTLEELISDYNDLKIRFNQLSVLSREARTAINSKLLADRESGQQVN